MGKKKVTYDKKEGVEFKMMFRHHQDPLYYDANANPKIFVPITQNMNEGQLKVVESFPAEDRGETLEADEYKRKGYGQNVPDVEQSGVEKGINNLVEMDEFEAAAKRHKIREAAKAEKKDRRMKEKYGVIDFKEEKLDENESEAINNKMKKADAEANDDDIIENSYDSEFEAEFFGGKNKELNAEIDEKLANQKLRENNGSDSDSDDDQIDSKKKPEKFDANDFKDDLVGDVNIDLKRFEKMKIADGIDFVAYDKYGFEIKENVDPKDDIRQYLAKEGDNVGFEYVAPNEEQMAKVLEMQGESDQNAGFTGGMKDIDKKIDKMNVEEKAVFDCLEDEQLVHEGAYEELDDDFILMLNDGKPAIELAKEMKPVILDTTQHENAGVEVVQDEDHEMMIPDYKDRMADIIAQLDKQNEIRKVAAETGVTGSKTEKEAKKAVNQKDLDDVFKSFMNKEYQDDQIGDLYGDEGVDPLGYIEDEDIVERNAVDEEGEDDMLDYGSMSDGGDDDKISKTMSQYPSTMSKLELKQQQDNVIISEAVNEFIQDKRLWFRDLKKDHGQDIMQEAKEKGAEFLPNTAKYIGPGLIPKPDDVDESTKEFKDMMKNKTLAVEEKFMDEMDARDPDYMTPSEESDPDDQWDADTILTTNTNTDNHPGVIKFTPKIKVKNKIELHTQFKVPIEGLNGMLPMAEVIQAKRELKKKSYKNAFEEDSEISEQDEDEETAAEKNPEEEAADGEEKKLNPRKEAKKALKAERKDRRAQKKELKVAFKTHGLKVVKQATVVTAGEIRPGISVKKIY